MNKKQLIALAIIGFVILIPFRMAYINFTIESELPQVLAMTISITGVVIAILLYNKGAEQPDNHTH